MELRKQEVRRLNLIQYEKALKVISPQRRNTLRQPRGGRVIEGYRGWAQYVGTRDDELCTIFWEHSQRYCVYYIQASGKGQLDFAMYNEGSVLSSTNRYTMRKQHNNLTFEVICKYLVYCVKDHK